MELEDLKAQWIESASKPGVWGRLGVEDLRRLDATASRRERRLVWQAAREVAWLWLVWAVGCWFLWSGRADADTMSLAWLTGANVALTSATLWLLARSVRAVLVAPHAVDIDTALDRAIGRVGALIEIWRLAAVLLGLGIVSLVFFDVDPSHRLFNLRVALASFAVPLLVVSVKHWRGFLAGEARALREQLATLRSLPTD